MEVGQVISRPRAARDHSWKVAMVEYLASVCRPQVSSNSFKQDPRKAGLEEAAEDVLEVAVAAVS